MSRALYGLIGVSAQGAEIPKRKTCLAAMKATRTAMSTPAAAAAAAPAMPSFPFCFHWKQRRPSTPFRSCEGKVRSWLKSTHSCA